MNFAIYKTRLGLYKIVYCGDCLVALSHSAAAVTDYGTKSAFSDEVYRQLEEYFYGKRKVFDFAYKLSGTDFQKRVWQQLCQIPYGETRTYKDIALAIGKPNASRAVGMANNKNPLGIVVPCHRVIGSDGKLVGYAGGLDIKRKLLRIEGVLSE